MSLNKHTSSLTANAKASVRKVSLFVIKDLDKERKKWLTDVTTKSTLLGAEDTLQTKWVPIDNDSRVKVIGTKAINSSSVLRGTMSSKTPRRAVGDERAGAALDEARFAGVKASDLESQTQGRRDLEETKFTRSSASQAQRETSSSSSSARAMKPEQDDPADSERERGDDEMDDEILRLRKQIKQMEIDHLLKELEWKQAFKKSTQTAQAVTPPGDVLDATDTQHRGYYGLREDSIVETLIQSEFNKHKTWTHPESGREENQSEREARMIFYDMLVNSLQNFRTMFTSELVGDNYAIVRNVMKYGAPNSMKMKIELTKKLGNYVKQAEQGYQEYEYGLRSLVDELASVGQILSVEEITLRLLAGMTNDKRYSKECKELSDDSATYATSHLVFTQRAQSVGNLTSSRKVKEEVNAVTSDWGGGKGKGKGGRGNGKGGGRGGKGKGKGGNADADPKSKDRVSPCTSFLMKGSCRYGDDCTYEHLSLEKIKRMRDKSGGGGDKSTKKKKTKKSKGSDGDDSESEKKKKKSSKLCFDFQETGSCPRGKKCRYSHKSAEESAEESNMLESDSSDRSSEERSDESSETSDLTSSSESSSDHDSILSAAEIGSAKFKRTPIQGGRTTGSSLKTDKNKRTPKGERAEPSLKLAKQQVKRTPQGGKAEPSLKLAKQVKRTPQGERAEPSLKIVRQNNETKRTPQGERADPSLKLANQRKKKHLQVQFSESKARVPYAPGATRLYYGRRYETGQAVEINLPMRALDGMRCIITELWDTPDGVPYAKLRLMQRKQISDQIQNMLTTVGIRIQDLQLLDSSHPEELSLSEDAIHGIIDSGATRTIVPSDEYLVEGSVYDLEKPLSFKGYDKGGKLQSAKRAGTIALKSNTSMRGYVLLMAYVLPSARRPLVSMSQLDDAGCYVEMGGGGMRLRKGADHSNFLVLPRLEPELAKEYARDLKREYSQNNTIKWDLKYTDKIPLYPIPTSLFVTSPLDWEDSEATMRHQLSLYHAEGKGEYTLAKQKDVVITQSDDEEELYNLATRYSEKEKLELRHAQLAHRSMLQIQTMMHWDGDGPRPKPHTVCWCASCVIAKAHAGTPKKKAYNNASRAPLDHVYADCSVDMGESAEGYRHYLCIFESHWFNFFIYLLRTKAEAKEWLMVWLKRAELQQHPHKVRHLHIDGGELKTNELKAWAQRGGAVIHIPTPGDHEAQAKVERPIRTISEASRAIVTNGGGDNILHWPIGVISAAKALVLVPPMRCMRVKPRKGETPIERPLTPRENWTGQQYPNYKSQWKSMITPLCEVVAFSSKQQRKSKSVNPGAPSLYLSPAYDNDFELNDNLCQRYSDGKRFRARWLFANEDRMPLRDGPSKGLVMHPSITFGLKTPISGSASHIPMKAPRLVESKEDMATAQDLGRNTALTSIVDDEDEQEPEEGTPEVLEEPEPTEEPEEVLPDLPDLEETAMPSLEDLVLPEIEEKSEIPDSLPFEDGDAKYEEIDDEASEEEKVAPPPRSKSKSKEASKPTRQRVEVKEALRPPKPKRSQAEAKEVAPVETRRVTRASVKQTQSYKKDELYKPKPVAEGTTLETMWGTAQVHRSRINGDLELLWPSHADSGVHTIKSSDVGKLAWHPDEKEERYDYSGNRLDEIAEARNVHELHALQESETLFAGGKFMGFKISDLKGNVRAASVNAALPQPDHRLRYDHPFQELVRPAKEKELTGLCEKGTFGKPQELPKGHKRIPVMFVNVAKDDDKGMFEKIKSRLTVMGNKMKDTVSQADAYSPVTHPMSYKIILILHLNDPDVIFDVYDVEQAFLSVCQERDLYVGHPKGYVFIVTPKGKISWRALAPGEKAPETAVPVLLALYGSVESGKLFFKGWVGWHLRYGFRTIHYDKCYLVLDDKAGNFIKMSYHVDDGLVAHKGERMWHKYREAVSRRFLMKYQSLEEKKKFLGMRFHLDRKRGVCHIEQSALIMKMLMHFDMQNCNTALQSPFISPMPTKADIPESKEEQEAMQKSFDMYGAIGYLNYIQMGTRMDISCPLKVLSQFAAKFGKRHVALAKHMMRWLKKTINHTITLFGVNNPQIQLFTDTSHASNPDTRKSITAVIGKLGGNTIFWKCLYQSIVSHSSCESELMALDKGATMGMFLRWLTEALGGKVITPVPIFVDNQGAIHLANNPVGPNRNLHIHARYFYVRDLVDGQEYVVHYVSTNDQLADMLCTYKGSDSFMRFFDLASRCAVLKLDKNDVWVWVILR